MASKVLTIALGTDSAKLAEVQLSGKKVLVFNAYDVDFSEGLVDDGIISDVESLAEEIRSFTKSHGIRSKRIVYSISSKRIASKEVIIPFIKEKQIGSIIRVNAAEYFPISNLEDYSLNYSILEVIKSEDKKQYRLSVTATPNDLLEKYYELADNLKMSVDTIDYAGNSILQVLQLQTNDEVNAILQLGNENTVINIMNGKTLVMQRSVSYGMDAILNAVKDAVGLDDDDALAFLEDNDIQKICSAYSDVDEVVSIITSGVGRIFEFYSSRSGDHPITGIRFIGDGTSINGIGNSIERNFGFPTEEIFTLKNVAVKGKVVTPEQATNFMANIGSVLAPMNIQFISKEESEKKAKEETKLPWWLLVVAVIGAGALAGSSVFMYYTTKLQRDELQRQVSSLAGMQDLEDQLNAARAKTNVLDEFYNSTKGPGDSLSRLIKDMETIMPKNMSIDSFTLTDGLVSMNGGGLGKDNVAKFIQEMKKLKYVDNVKVDIVSEIQDGVSAYDSYAMSFNLLDVKSIEENEENGEETSDTIEIEAPVENVNEDGISVENSLGGEE